MDIIYIHGWVFITILHGFIFKSGPTTWIVGAVTPSILDLIFMSYTIIKF